MCVQYRGGCLEYRRGCSVPWGIYHDKCGVYRQYRGGNYLLLFEYGGGIMIHVGDIMSTVGCSVPWNNKR